MSRHLMRILGLKTSANWSDARRKQQSELAKRLYQRRKIKLHEYGRIGWLEDEIHALSAADGVPVTTVNLAQWAFCGVRWDMCIRRTPIPFDELPYEYARLPKYPPIPLAGPRPTRSQLRCVLEAARTFGKPVGRGKGKGGSVLWVMREDRQYYCEIREEKTAQYAARRAKREKAERRKTNRYGKR